MQNSQILRRVWEYEGITQRHFRDRDRLVSRLIRTKTDANGYAFIEAADPNAIIAVYSPYVVNGDTLELQGIIHDINGSISLYKHDMAVVRSVVVTNVAEINSLLSRQEFRDALFFIFVKGDEQYYYHKTNGFTRYRPERVFPDYSDFAGYAGINSITANEWRVFYTEDVEIRMCSKFNYFRLPTVKYRVTYTKDTDVMFNIAEVCNLTIALDGLHLNSRRINGDIEVVALNSIYDIYPNYIEK
jgi:hypothetical protein